MFYRLLGMLVWNAGRWWFRRKYAVARAPWPIVAGASVLAVAGALLATRKRLESG